MHFFLTLLLSSFWWLSVIQYHGTAPFSATFNSHGWETGGAKFLAYILANDLFIKAIAFIGLTVSSHKNKFLFSSWIIAIFILTTRSANQFSIIPLAMAFGTGLEILLRRSLQENLSKKKLKFINQPIFIGLIFLAFMQSYSPVISSSAFETLTPYQQESLSWINKNAKEDSNIIVIEEAEFIFAKISEWLPALTTANSIATVQGYEWLNNVNFHDRIHAYERLQNCRWDNDICLSNWANEQKTTYDYVLILKPTKQSKLNAEVPLLEALIQSEKHRPVFENDAVVIFEHLR